MPELRRPDRPHVCTWYTSNSGYTYVCCPTKYAYFNDTPNPYNRSIRTEHDSPARTINTENSETREASGAGDDFKGGGSLVATWAETRKRRRGDFG